jgi:hypothetical protein
MMRESVSSGMYQSERNDMLPPHTSQQPLLSMSMLLT